MAQKTFKFSRESHIAARDFRSPSKIVADAKVGAKNSVSPVAIVIQKRLENFEIKENAYALEPTVLKKSMWG